MSFDIFLACFRNGEPHPIERKLFDSIFLTHDLLNQNDPSDPGYMNVEYADGSGGSIYCDHLSGGHMMFNHCGGDTFFANVLQLADRTLSVIFWPDEHPIYVYTNEAVAKELPKDMINKTARVRVVRSVEDIRKAIEES